MKTKITTILATLLILTLTIFLISLKSTTAQQCPVPRSLSWYSANWLSNIIPMTSGTKYVLKESPMYVDNSNIVKVQTDICTNGGACLSQSAGGISGMYAAFPDPNPRSGWIYTGFYETKGVGSWTTKAPALVALGNTTGGAVINGKIHILRGNDQTSDHEIYDPVTDTWSAGPGMPQPADGFVVAAVNGKLYAIGGYNGYIGVLRNNQEYDPDTNTWTQRSPMPTARYIPTGGVANNKIYVIGGYNNSTRRENEEYDPSTDQWIQKAPIPIGVYRGAATAVFNNKIYVIGGYNQDLDSYLNNVQQYDPSTDQWIQRNPMPTPRGKLSAVELNGKIYALGGYNDAQGMLAINEEYDPITDSWTTNRAPLSIPRTYMAAVSVNGKIYAIGGNPDQTLNEEYTPSLYFYWFQKQ